ncbi:MAG: hypothetical protein GX594_00955 [Pirellulaceae bacterium]|nr:hypothetical protein [Pirellulaceae bacterium]
MIAGIIGLCAIFVGLQLLCPIRDPILKRRIPVGKPAKIFGVFHIICGLSLICYVTINTVNLHLEYQNLEDVQSGQERQIEY